MAVLVVPDSKNVDIRPDSRAVWHASNRINLDLTNRVHVLCEYFLLL